MKWTDNSQKENHKMLISICKCVQSLLTKKMEIKTALRFHFFWVTMANIMKANSSKCLWWCEKSGALSPCWCECKLLKTLWNSAWRFLKKLKIDLPHNPAKPFLDSLSEGWSILSPTTEILRHTLIAEWQNKVGKWNHLDVNKQMIGCKLWLPQSCGPRSPVTHL